MRFSPDLETRRYLELAAVLALVVLVLGIATDVSGVVRVYADSGRNDSFSTQPLEQGLWFTLSVPLSAAAPLLALRRPFAAALAALVLPLGSLVFAVALFSAFLGVLATGAVLLRRSAALGSTVSVLGLPLPVVYVLGGTLVMPDGSTIFDYGYDSGRLVTSVVLYVVGVALALAAGLGYRTWARNAHLQARLSADRVEVSNAAGLLGERSRLARDLHDVVAHHVSLIAVRAETAPYTVEDLSPAARLVLADIADDSRKALDELRGVLGILRRADEDSGRAPQPGAGDVPDLVERSRSAGEVALEGVEALDALDSTRGYVVYRVVQEALTNARRHAPGASVRVECAAIEGGVRLRVANSAAADAPVTPGRGLTGMRERVEAVGGTLAVEVRGGDLVVEAVLPA